MNGLDPVPLLQFGFLRRLFRRPPTENAWREINNLVATTPIPQIPETAAQSVLERYKLGHASVAANLCDIYGDVLRHFVADHKLSDAEAKDLLRLRDILGLSDRDLQQLETDVYRQAARAAVMDRELTSEERGRLEGLLHRLTLPKDIAAQILGEEAAATVKRVIEQVGQDRRLSADEERELAAVAANLGMELKADAKTAAALDRYRLLWLLEQGHLPSIETSIRLQRGEVCHAAAPASHHELRTRTRAIRYGGPRARVRICKGLYWTAGQVSVQRVTEESLVELDTGTLYFTCKRLLFDGSRKSTSIPLKRVITFTVHQNGLMIEKDSGKDQFFACSGDLEVLGTLLDSALTTSR